MRKNTKKVDAIIIVVLIAAIVAIVISAVRSNLSNGAEASTEQKYEHIEDMPLSELADKRIGVMTGSLYEQFAMERYPNAPLSYFNTQPDMSAALAGNKIDCFFVPELTAREFAAADDTLTYLNEVFVQLNYAYAFPKDSSSVKLCEQMNEYLAKIRENGLYDELVDTWLEKRDSDATVDMTGLTGENGTVRFATTGTFEPFSYIKDGECVGFEVDIAVRFCREYGYNIEISLMDFGSIIPGLTAHKYDMAGCNITITEERAQSIRFSDSDYTANAVAMVRKSGMGSDGESKGFFEKLAKSFERTFIVESRWMLIVEGVITTAIITVLSAIFGTLLGFLLVLFRRTGSRLAGIICNIYVRIFQGMPMVVLLMILYYLIFGSADIPAIIVAVIGFSLNLGATVSEMMNSGIRAINPGQNEAALALGFTGWQAFFKFIFPQAVVGIMPVYKGALVTLLKNTAIVGYIAIQDLTKMSDLIRSRTYEAFFPLIVTAIIYFLIAWLITFLVGKIEINIDPRSRKRR